MARATMASMSPPSRAGSGRRRDVVAGSDVVRAGGRMRETRSGVVCGTACSSATRPCFSGRCARRPRNEEVIGQRA